MNLVLFLAPTGRMISGWRSPTAPVEGLWGLDVPLRLTQQAERAKFDAIFIADAPPIAEADDDVGRRPATLSRGYEPFTLLGALAARTARIGLIATASTSFIHPFNLARFMASLDWLSGGRVGWNVVTSSAGGEPYGIELPPKHERYARAQEYLDVAKALWDAYDDDAVVIDRENAIWARADRIYPVDFEGRYFRVRGRLAVHRSPQGHPVIVQAGQSEEGMNYAARNAEVVFTAQSEIDGAREFYRELKQRAVAAGRDPAQIKILPGVAPIVGTTAAEARALEEQSERNVDIKTGLKDAEVLLQTELRDLDLDQPIPPDRLPHPDVAERHARQASRYRNYYDRAVRQKLTLRRIIALNDRSLGHYNVTGSIEDVADEFQEWFESYACDGFTIMPVTVPEVQDSVCDLLVPELQRRGLARAEYEGVTLREHLGLKRPATRGRVARDAEHV